MAAYQLREFEHLYASSLRVKKVITGSGSGEGALRFDLGLPLDEAD